MDRVLGFFGSSGMPLPRVARLNAVAPDSNHVINQTPTLHWYSIQKLGGSQTQYELQVGNDADWSVAEMWATGVVTSTDTGVVYAGSALSDGGSYYARLRVYDGTDWSPWYQSRFHMNAPPTVPICSSPVLNMTTSNPPVLTLVNATDAESDVLKYDFETYQDSALTVLISQGLNVTAGTLTSSWTSTGMLTENGRAFWRCRAYDGNEHGSWSAAAGFWVDGIPQPPTAPVLNPIAGDTMELFTMLPTITWTGSTDPDPQDVVHYKLELAQNPSFTAPTIKDNIPGTTVTLIDSLLFGKHYYWRVSAVDKTNLATVSTPGREFWTWQLGDINHSHVTDAADLSALVSYLTGGAAVIRPHKVGDLTGNCGVDATDLSTLVSYLTGGSATLKPGCE